jgi:hypothetical protein
MKFFETIVKLSDYAAKSIYFKDLIDFDDLKPKELAFTFTPFRSQFPQLLGINVNYDMLDLTAFTLKMGGGRVNTDFVDAT